MLTLSQITPYLANSGSPNAQYLHEFYQPSIDLKKSLEELFSEQYPSYLDLNRPREQAKEKAYRKRVYRNTFKSLPRRISTILDFIRQADDFAVVFPPDPESIDEAETLEKYTSKETLTTSGPLTEYFFKEALMPYLLDPNAVLLAIPMSQPVTDKEFPSPTPIVVPCENVYSFREGRFLAALYPEANIYLDSAGAEKKGRIYVFADHESYCVCKETGASQGDNASKLVQWEITGIDTSTEDESTFNPPLHYHIGLPAIKIGKVLSKRNSSRETLYDSILSDATPHIKEGQQIQSDKQVERNFHVSSQEYRFASAKCAYPGCTNGKIHTRDTEGKITGSTDCPSCSGTGLNTASGSGLGMIWVNNVTEPGDTTKRASGVPGGYIPRNIEPLKQLVTDYDKEVQETYTTLNMQFIRQTPLVASGLSKRYDREELYRELNTQAEHLLDLLKKVYEIIDALRYGFRDAAGKQVPEIIVPIRFNLENAELTREELNDAKAKQYDPALVEAYERKLLSYAVGVTAPEYLQYDTKTLLDPFKAMSIDQKNVASGMVFAMLQPGPQRTAALKEIFFSVFFDALMTKATTEDPGFFEMTIDARHAKLREIFDEYFADVYESNELPILPNLNSMQIRPTANLISPKQTGADSNRFEQ